MRRVRIELSQGLPVSECKIDTRSSTCVVDGTCVFGY